MEGRDIPTSLSFVKSHLQQQLRSAPRASPEIIEGILEGLAYVERTWRRIKAALSDAQEREIREKSARLWLRELRDLAYEAEDLLDSYQYQQLARQVREEELEAHGRAGTSHKATHGDDDHQEGDDDTEELREIAKGVEKIQKRFKEISDQKDALHLKEADGRRQWFSDDATAAPGTSQRTTSSLITEEVIFGREADKQKLLQMLLKSPDGDHNETGVVALVGMGGLGKTTLAQHAFKEACKHFKHWGWVCVSDDFDVVHLTKAVVEAFTKRPCPDLEQLDALQNYLIFDVIKQEKFLLVMDDVWNENFPQWEKFVTPLRHYGAKGSKILITTRNLSVAHTASAVEQLQLYHLSAEDGWSLFERYTFHSRVEKKRRLVEIGRKIVEKCKGLPLAIKVLASLLGPRTIIYDDCDEEERWKSVLDSDLWDVEKAGGRDILGPLLLSYHHLPTHLKPCFAFLSVFPKDWSIKSKVVIRLWRAHGLIQAENELQLKIAGRKYLRELTMRSFLQPNNKNDDVSMHDLIHDLAQHISGEECYTIIQKNSVSGPKSNVRHLSITGSNIDVYQCLYSHGIIRLRTLLILNYLLMDTMDAIFQRFEHLRALDLRDIIIEGLAPDFFIDMKHLCYLNLSCARIKELPESIFILYNLQELDLSESSIAQLSDSVGNFKRLCRLDLSNTAIMQLPEGICKLSNLQHLKLVSMTIKELPNSICKLHNLRVMNVSNCRSILELPESIGELHNLQKLIVFQCHQLRELPKNIQNLTNLQLLDIEGCDDISYLPANIKRLTKLQHLSWFPVGDITNGHAGILELKYLVDLHDRSLLLTGLRNAVKETCFADANILVNIESLETLWLNWGSLEEEEEELAKHEEVWQDLRPYGNTKNLSIQMVKRFGRPSWLAKTKHEEEEDEEEEEAEVAKHKEVLGSLKPPRNLRELCIQRYKGFHLPSWLADPSFKSLTRVTLHNFRRCSVLPDMSRLPSLEYLFIKDMKILKEVNCDQGHFPKLVELIISDCPLLVSFHFSAPSLLKLVLDKCNSLKSIPLYKLPALTTLSLSRCKNLESIEFEGPLLIGQTPRSSMISLQDFKISDCPLLHLSNDIKLPRSLSTRSSSEGWCHACSKIRLEHVQSISEERRQKYVHFWQKYSRKEVIIKNMVTQCQFKSAAERSWALQMIASSTGCQSMTVSNKGEVIVDGGEFRKKLIAKFRKKFGWADFVRIETVGKSPRLF